VVVIGTADAVGGLVGHAGQYGGQEVDAVSGGGGEGGLGGGGGQEEEGEEE